MIIRGHVINGRIEVEGFELPEGASVTIEIAEGPPLTTEEEEFVAREFAASFQDDLIPVTDLKVRLTALIHST